MADGTSSDPITIDPTYRFIVKFFQRYFSGESEVQEFIEAVSPQIRAKVSPGQCFAFTTDSSIVFILMKDENDSLFFMRWPAMTTFPRYYLVSEDDSRPWLRDRIDELNRRVKELNPFSQLDSFFE
jgi:hypothetical protein